MNMRTRLFTVMFVVWAPAGPFVFAQTLPPASVTQQPNYQPNWPCTGKERAFDPAYSRVAEATGGHLFLFDKSEVAGWSALMTGDAQHKATIVRAAGKIVSFVDIPFWIDSSVESLFVVASLQCMQTIYVYDPRRVGVDAKTEGVEDNWFHAGRVSTIPKPQPGSWVVRLLGTGAYGVAIEAKTSATLGSVEKKGDTLSISLGAGISNPLFRLINAAGEPVQPVALASDPDSPSRFSGSLPPLAVDVRLQGEWRNSTGETVLRTDPRLWEHADSTPALVK
jgi:hypothetical protein